MFYSRGVNNKINRIHERALRITYNDKSSSYRELLTKDRSLTIHHRNIRALAIEIYKVMQGISPPFLNEMFVHVNVIINSVEITLYRKEEIIVMIYVIIVIRRVLYMWNYRIQYSK